MRCLSGLFRPVPKIEAVSSIWPADVLLCWFISADGQSALRPSCTGRKLSPGSPHDGQGGAKGTRKGAKPAKGEREPATNKKPAKGWEPPKAGSPRRAGSPPQAQKPSEKRAGRAGRADAGWEPAKAPRATVNQGREPAKERQEHD